MKLALTPTDTFFFRDGKPFTRAEQTEAETIFPPFPSTVYGALRAAYISSQNWNLFWRGIRRPQSPNRVCHVIGTPTSYGTFRLKGVFLENTRFKVTYFPLPMDLLYAKNTETLDRLIRRQHVQHSNSELQEMLMQNPDATRKGKVEYPAGALLNGADLQAYLAGHGPDVFSPLFSDQYFEYEPKIGIQRELRGLEDEPHLYRFNMMRFHADYRLLADVRGISFAANGVMKLGGEARPCEYVRTRLPILPDYDRQAIIANITSSGEFLLYLATPAIWKQGWRPDWMNGKRRYAHGGVKCRLIAAAVGKYQMIGGWDMANHRPKPMYRAVPAGSVYYLRLEAGAPEEVLNLFHYQNISDRLSEEGFGLIFVGVVPSRQ